jgi:hypothetical protein
MTEYKIIQGNLCKHLSSHVPEGTWYYFWVHIEVKYLGCVLHMLIVDNSVSCILCALDLCFKV